MAESVTPVSILAGRDLRAAPSGHVVLRIRGGAGPVTVTLSSARPLTPRWLGGVRARVVRLGRSDVTLRPGVVTTVSIQLSKHHVELLHRMRTLRTTIRVASGDHVHRRRINLHPPARRRVCCRA